MENKKENQRNLVFSYLTLRQAIGILGMALPFVLSLGALLLFHTGLQSSISDYYHSCMRDVFVGTLWAIGFFLFSYKGYCRSDNIAGNLGCVFAIGVTLIPDAYGKITMSFNETSGIIHLTFAFLFFCTLIYFSLFLFTKTGTAIPSKKKLQRNIVYKTCGYIMIICILLIAIIFILPGSIKSHIEALKPVFWLEALAILAFGVSWITKGEAILKDEVK